MGRNYERPELTVWENEELDVIRTSSIGDSKKEDNGADDLVWSGGWES